MDLISSRKNAEVRAALTVAESAKERRKSGLLFVEGARLCEDAARSGMKIEKLFVTKEALTKYADYLTPVLECAEKSFEIEEHVADLLTQTKHAQGVFCVCRAPQKQAFRFKGKWAVLENIQDPANLGGIMRTAEALGIAGLIVIAGCDVFSPKVIRASMGAVFRMQILICKDFDEFLQLTEIDRTSCFAAVPDESAEKLGQITFPNHAMIFIGNEGNGLTEDVIRFCTHKITIPMRGRAESFNAAAAAAICLWEIVKQ